MMDLLDFVLLIFLAGCIAGAMVARGRLFGWCIGGFVASGSIAWWLFENAL